MIIKTAIVGMRYRPNVSAFDLDCAKTQPIILEREPSNPHDPLAVKCNVNGKHVGYIAKHDAAILSPKLLECKSYRVHFNYRTNHSIRITVFIDEGFQQISASNASTYRPQKLEELKRKSRDIERSQKNSDIAGPTRVPPSLNQTAGPFLRRPNHGRS